MRSEKSLQILRRVHTNSEDNIQLPRSSSLLKCRRVRLNTIQNQQELMLKRSDTQKSAGIQLQPLLPEPPKYYQSRLVLSCESWSAYNLLQKKYKRGWRPIKIVNFNGFLSLVILKIFYELQQSHPWVGRVFVKASRFLLKEEESDRCKSLVEQFKLKSQKQKQADPYLLAQSTIISLRDMLIGSLFTNYDDFSQYQVIFMGAVIRDIRQHNDSHNKTYQFKQPEIDQGKLPQKQTAIQTFVDYANSWLKSSQYLSSSLNKACEFYSCPDQITRIFASLLSNHPSFQILISRRETVLPIKYQVGNHFYQDRKLKITHEWPCIKDHLIIKSKNKYNFVVASFNKATQNVVALYDCKYNMEDIDLFRIEDFLLNLSKPIVQKKGKPSSTLKLPILKISQ